MTTPGEVADFHQLSDLDARENAQHHTLGTGAFQAAPGGKTHRRLTTLEGYFPGGVLPLSHGGTGAGTSINAAHSLRVMNANADSSRPALSTLNATGMYSYSPAADPDLPDTANYYVVESRQWAGRWEQKAHTFGGAIYYRYAAPTNDAPPTGWTGWRIMAQPGANWTPTFSGFTLGNGTINLARYQITDRLCQVNGRVTLGSTSAVSGDIVLGHPPGINVNVGSIASGGLVNRIHDNSVGLDFFAMVLVNATGIYVRPAVSDTTTGALKSGPAGASFPFTWAVSDWFEFSAIYPIS